MQGSPAIRRWRPAVVAVVAALACVALTTAQAAAPAGAVLVVVAHPDDEAIGFAGIIESALAQGRPVDVAVVTNGDASRSGSDSGWCGAAAGNAATTARYGITRDRETLAGMGMLGLARTTSLATTNIFFLGYPDGGLQTIAGSSAGWTGDATGLHHTYADDGDGGNATCNGDLHYLATGSHADLSAASLDGDLDRLLALTSPTDVYTHAAFDGHPDHAVVNQRVLAAIARAGIAPAVHVTLMHPQGVGGCLSTSAYLWPNPSDPSQLSPFSRFTPQLDVTAPPTPACSLSPTGSSWGAAGPPNELVAVPADMRSIDPATNRKWQVISQYASQIPCTPYPDGSYNAGCGYMRAFVKAHEFFWTSGGGSPAAPVNVTLPVISGTPTQGQTLTATDGSWTGSPSGYAYAWQRCDAGGAGCTAIGGATTASYLLAAADAGSTIRIAVTATNGVGSATATSDATQAVAAAGSTGTLGQTAAGGSWDTGGSGWLDVSGPYALASAATLTQLNAYVAGGSAPSRARGIVYADAGGKPGALVAVTAEATTAAGAAAGWVALPVSPSVSLAAGSYWLGYWYADGNGRRAYTAASGAERYAPASYAASGAPPATFPAASTASSRYSLYATLTSGAPPSTPPLSTAPPSVGGSAVQGQTLSASTGTWSGDPSSFAYEWRRCDSGGGACAAIAGAAATSYVLVAADVGATIRVAVTATNGAGSTTAVSAATATVAGGAAPVGTAAPTIGGSAVQGQTLTATTGTWSGDPSSFAYEWRRCDSGGASCTAIASAAATSYVLVAADVGATLRVAVTATNGFGSTTAVSAATATVAAASSPGSSLGQTTAGTLVDTGGSGYLDVSGPYALASAATATALQAYLAGGSASSRVRGVVYADSGGRPGALVAVTSELSVAAGAAASWATLPLPSPVALAAGGYWLGYWYADGNGRHYYVSQAGSERYVPAAYSATGSPPASFGSGGSASSSYSLVALLTGGGTPPPAAPANTALPAVSGSPVEGSTLTASTGAWTGSPTSYAYEWRRCDSAGSGCAAIAGAAAATYPLAAADVGSTIRVAVTATNGGGGTTAVSAPTAVVTASGGGGGGTQGSFGQPAVGTATDNGGAGYLDVSGPYPLAAAGSVFELRAYLSGGSATSHLRGVIYADAGGAPGALVAAGPDVSVAAGAGGAWMSLAFASPVPLAAGSYWLGFWYADGNSRRFYVDRAGAERYTAVPYSATGSPPTSFGSASSASSDYSVTATYSVP